MGLREQAKLDARAILEDTSGFAWPVTLTSPLGEVTSLLGFTTDIGQTIDPETGQAVAGRRASVTVPRGALASLPEAIADKRRKPWLATFADTQGAVLSWKVIDVLPDAAIGVVVLIVELYALSTVKLTGALVLPALELDGQLVLAFIGSLTLPALQLAGTFTVAVSVGGSFTLPALQLAGTFTVAVSVGGSFTLPALQLAGTFTVAVSVGGSFTLPALQLTGTYTVVTSPIAAWLRLAQGTVTGSGYSSVPDPTGATSPAVQTTDARRPVNSTAPNGLPIALLTDDFLAWPLNAANNGSTKNGFACWCQSTLSGLQNLLVIWGSGGGASANKLDFFTNGTALSYLAETGGSASIAALMSANAWHFVTVEYDGTQGSNAARCLVTVDGVVLGTTNTAVPTSQPTPTGSASIGGFAGSQFWVGKLGPNFWSLNRQLTATERSNLMNFEVPN